MKRMFSKQTTGLPKTENFKDIFQLTFSKVGNGKSFSGEKISGIGSNSTSLFMWIHHGVSKGTVTTVLEKMEKMTVDIQQFKLID